MISNKAQGHWAGVLYLVVVLTGLFSLMYVPAHLSGLDQTHQSLAQHVAVTAVWRRLSMVVFVVEQLAFLLLPWILFKLLARAGRGTATLMVALAWMSIPISLMAVVHQLDAVHWAVKAMPIPSRLDEALVRMALASARHSLWLAGLFWGLWLIPLGWLAMRTGLLPRVLCALLMLGGLGYLVDLAGTVLFPTYPGTWLAGGIMVPAELGEIGACLWLLVAGGRTSIKA
ncbi:DUF4386 domain-containing protein [Oleiagrimonas sp. C23AA]|uniref:DUF4386 domain-containing protein n=1 Tax=Oleiagrimonas sp. C23AA TaxID=2719047 RepID=UPI0014204336|nr:DUF4386 domain-containing protein [Oleiagrimonas sp. C23AA]NII09085.1 DUF4386 domain-containing protein [Oleiagrimonas sp. C23AA]